MIVTCLARVVYHLTPVECRQDACAPSVCACSDRLGRVSRKETEKDPSDGTKRRAYRDSPQLEEGIDYYLEGGLMVFTAPFLLRRGYCCESGCRHCPYKQVEPERSSPY